MDGKYFWERSIIKLFNWWTWDILQSDWFKRNKNAFCLWLTQTRRKSIISWKSFHFTYLTTSIKLISLNDLSKHYIVEKMYNGHNTFLFFRIPGSFSFISKTSILGNEGQFWVYWTLRNYGYNSWNCNLTEFETSNINSRQEIQFPSSWIIVAIVLLQTIAAKYSFKTIRSKEIVNGMKQILFSLNIWYQLELDN